MSLERTTVYNKWKYSHFSNSAEQISNPFLVAYLSFIFLTIREFFLSGLTSSCCKIIWSLMFNNPVFLDIVIKFTFNFFPLVLLIFPHESFSNSLIIFMVFL